MNCFICAGCWSAQVLTRRMAIWRCNSWYASCTGFVIRW